MFCMATLPNTRDQLEHLLCDESWCENYFFSRRWLSGFNCTRCNRQKVTPPEPGPTISTICPDCGNRLSLTSGTLLHGTKKSISQWLKAAWLLCNTINSVSIRNVQDKLQIKNYQTARNVMMKLHSVIRRENTKKCYGSVEIADCSLFVRKEKRNCHLFAAVEIDVKNNTIGRQRLYHCNDLSTDYLAGFLERCIQKSSIVLCPDREPYLSFHSGRYLILTGPGDRYLDSADKLLGTFQASQLNNSSSVFSLNRLRTLCNEFCFQENKKLFPDTLAVFDNLVAIMVENPHPRDYTHHAPSRDGGDV